MSHAHTQIRNAAKTALTGLTTSGSRVFANRLYALAAADLPGLRISLDDESVNTSTIHGPALYDRTLTLIVEACAKANSALDDTVDTMQNEVEKALANGLSISGHVIPAALSASRFDDDAGLVDAAVKRMEFTLNFYTLANAPDSFV